MFWRIIFFFILSVIPCRFKMRKLLWSFTSSHTFVSARPCLIFEQNVNWYWCQYFTTVENRFTFSRLSIYAIIPFSIYFIYIACVLLALTHRTTNAITYLLPVINYKMKSASDMIKPKHEKWWSLTFLHVHQEKWDVLSQKSNYNFFHLLGQLVAPEQIHF